MIFVLDEEMEKLRIDESCAVSEDDSDFSEIPDTVNALEDDGHLRVVAGGCGRPARRRSSALERMVVKTPLDSRRLSIGSVPKESNVTKLEEGTPRDNPGYGRVLEDFKPVRVLGKGAYGKVILVKDRHTDKLFAMKQLKKAEIFISPTDNDKETGEDVIYKRVQQTFMERTILSHLEHPNIVKLFYSFQDSTRLYLILQYIPGGELFYHLKEQGTLNEDAVSFYAAEISCALKFLHSKGIVYRDLKPENCLLDQNGHLVLTDFGLSKEGVSQSNSETISETNDDIDTLHSIIGTPEYCAPEILQGLSYTKNCDWYSLGCLMYDMLVGKPPFTGVNHKVVLNKIQKEKQGPKIPFYLSDGMKDILGALLKKDQDKRWDVDKYWLPVRTNSTTKGTRKKKKAGQERTSAFQEHFIFRKINWPEMENGILQKTTMGPIVPFITNWELAENFDVEFTSMSYEEGEDLKNLEIPQEMGINNPGDLFKGFSYKATGSYLERYF